MSGTARTVTQYAFSGEVEKNLDIYTHTDGSTRVARRYTYDHAGRPLKVYHKSGTAWSSNNFYNENGIAYSANGNITALARYREKAGASAQIDQLAYSYNDNQLTGVSDGAPAANKADGFRDGNTGTDYTYNGNGFLVSDKNKGIDSVVYNLMDLPQRIDFGDGKNIRYTYGAGGGLMTVAYHNTSRGPAVRTVRHVGELLFENGTLKEIRHGSGRMLADAGYKYLPIAIGVPD